MKKTFLLLLISLGITSCMAPKEVISINPISKIVQIPGEEKNNLFVKSNSWMIHIFKDARSVIQFSDKEEGVIIGKYFLSASYSTTYQELEPIFAIIRIDVKNSAAKITITPGEYEIYNSTMLRPEYRYTEEKAREDITGVIESFEEYITSSNSNVW